MSKIRKVILLASAAALSAAPVAATAAHLSYFTAPLTELNNSGVTGNAFFTYNSNANTLHARVRAFGLVPNTLHPQHVHGSFAPDASCTDFAPPSSPIAGACLDGSTAIESNIPTIPENDIDGDGFLETVEGAPAYGPIILSLGDPDAGRDALPGSFPMSDENGELFFEATYDLATTDLLFDTIDGIVHEPEDLFPLIERVFVIHGMFVDGPGCCMFEVTEDTMNEYVVLLPAAAGELQVPAPAALALFGMGAIGLGLARRRRA